MDKGIHGISWPPIPDPTAYQDLTAFLPWFLSPPPPDMGYHVDVRHWTTIALCCSYGKLCCGSGYVDWYLVDVIPFEEMRERYNSPLPQSLASNSVALDEYQSMSS